MLASVSTRRLPRNVRELQMLDAAVVEFARLGFHAASMDDIAARAGISKPMVYAYLGAKDDLFVACLHREGTRVMQAIVDVVDPALAPDEQLWHGMRAFFSYVAANRDGWSVLYRQSQGPFADEVAAMRARMIEVVAGMLARAVESRGRLPRTTDLTPLAFALVGASESLADWLADHPDEKPDSVAGRLMNVVWLGAAQLLDGVTWRPLAPDVASQSTGLSWPPPSSVAEPGNGDYPPAAVAIRRRPS
jgi:AcrR family transcriptional regulator